MDIYRLIQVILRKLKYIIAVPIVAGAIMFYISRDQPKIYSSRASIFTAITSNPSIDNLGNARVDFFATRTAYNNLLSILSSRNVIEETSLRLFTKHLMLDKPDPKIISETSYQNLQKIIPPSLKEMVVENDYEETFLKLQAFMQQDKNNFLYGLLNYEHPHYSYKAISEKMKIQQIGSSDIVEITYELDDPAIVFQTLNIFIDVFFNEYSKLKQNQTSAVVEYFEGQLRKSSEQLGFVEDNLLDFNKKNNIVNYYEQTKHISSQQEKIEVKLQEVLLEFQSAEAILKKLEEETEARFKININTKEILELRKSLIELKESLAKIAMEKTDLFQKTPQEKELHKKEQTLRAELQQKIDSLHVYGRNSEGMEIEVLLNNWLNTVMEYEGAKARLLAMKQKSEEFAGLYAKYAPLGATLKRIEREIDVREKEYLEILHHLGLAKLKQQNEEMMAKMKILDRPQLSINPKSSKRKLFILVIMFFSFIFSVLGILIFELLDKTIKYPKRIEKLTGLKTAGAYAISKNSKTSANKKLNIAGIKSVTESILRAKTQFSESPVVVQFLSHWQGEGKTFIIEILEKQLSKLGYKCSSLILPDNGDINSGESDILFSQVHDAKSYNHLIQAIPDNGKNDIVLIEVPAASSETFNTALLSTARLSYFIADARRNWETADEYLLRNKKDQINGNLECILNFVIPDEMIEFTGIQSQKKWYHKLLKRI